jgi:hypothetical protein
MLSSMTTTDWQFYQQLPRHNVGKRCHEIFTAYVYDSKSPTLQHAIDFREQAAFTVQLQIRSEHLQLLCVKAKRKQKRTMQ